ncbi:MAG: FixH family protein [Sphingobacteriales bacterium]|nr:FixH family protein [Sphingobacteriales bacterium]
MNWGNKLLITFIVFGAGMSFMVYKSVNSKFELVSKEYYKDELAYQQVIDGTKNADALTSKLTITEDEKNIVLQLPEELKGKKITGSVWFYSAADETKDRKFELKTNADGKQFFENKLFFPINYKVKIDWKADSEHYYTEKDFSIK